MTNVSSGAVARWRAGRVGGRRAGSAAVGGPVCAVAETASPPGSPRLVRSCQPPGGAVWLAAVARARAVAKVSPVGAAARGPVRAAADTALPLDCPRGPLGCQATFLP